jgi:hypothetical protein
MFLYVTNKNGFTHTDRYNGQDFVFEPNTPVVVEANAVTHMFGYGRRDKTENLIRVAKRRSEGENPREIRHY